MFTQNYYTIEIKTKAAYKLGYLIRTGNKKTFFSIGDITKWSYKFYTLTQIFNGAIPS